MNPSGHAYYDIVTEPDDAEWTTQEWVQKLKQQARDSMEYRHRLYERVGLSECDSVLDVGCGTGAITVDLAELTEGHVIGVDIDEAKLEEARKVLSGVPNLEFRNADAQDLPFEDGAFDLVVFNIVLIYVPDKQRALDEMARVTRSGGHVLATLEPDYAGEIHYPEDPFRQIMRDNLKSIGADLETGRRLKFLFTKAGLKTDVCMDTESDFVYQMDDARRLEMFQDQFWVFEKAFLRAGWTEDRIEAYREEHEDLMRKGLSFSFMPGFYAIGRKP